MRNYKKILKMCEIIKKEGYNFSFNPKKCEECGGRCCYGESGYIFASVAELEQVAKFLNISLESLCLKYVKKVGARFSFIEQKCFLQENGIRCVFFNEETKKCNIYPARPKQCRTFPFWNMYKNDKSELFERCIGVKEN